MASLLERVETVPVASLEFFPGNARRGDIKGIAESLTENAQFAPLVVQRSTRFVLAGNQTLRSAQSLGWEHIDVVFVDVDDRRAAKINVAANRYQDLGSWDQDALATQLEEFEGDFGGTGWSDRAVADFFSARDARLRIPAPGPTEGNGREPVVLGVIVECPDTDAQERLCHQLTAEGWACRSVAL